MRILLVSHFFLPNHLSGTEIYTAQVGLELLSRGHDVHVFTTEKDISRPNLGVRLWHHRGLPVHELTNNLFYNRFEETWDYPPLVESFKRLLDDLRPDVVHFMHLLHLSVGCVEEVARRGIPVLYTLHDYWLQCARYGQRVHADTTICHTIDFDRCGQCLAGYKFKQTRLERATAKLVARLRSRTGVNLGPLARGVGETFKAVAGAELAPSSDAAGAGAGDPDEVQGPPASPVSPDPEAVEMAAKVRERDRVLRERLLPHVFRFLAPSRFLRDRLLEWGIPAHQISYMRTGIDLESFHWAERTRSDKVRVAFIGTLAHHKGVHVLLDAWSRIPAELRARAELQVFGPLTHNPSYIRRLRALAAPTEVELAGRLRRRDVHRTLAEVDLLVVPSVWYENSPLIILEALAMRTPLLVSDLGGMAELVEEGVSGFHFRVGDAGHLASRIRSVIEDPGLLEALYPEDMPVPVKGVQVDARELEALYAAALEAVQRSGKR